MFTINITNSVVVSTDPSGDNNVIFFDGFSPMVANICNNVVYGGFEGIVLYDDVQGTVLNNIVSGCALGGISLLPSTMPEQLIVDYNDVNPAIPDPYESDPSFIAPHNLTVDPLFTNPATNDFTLQDGSPCRDAGIGNGTQPTVPLIDFNNVTRRTDITAMGIFEYLPVPPPPPPPPPPPSQPLSTTPLPSPASGGAPLSIANEPLNVYQPLKPGAGASGKSAAPAAVKPPIMTPPIEGAGLLTYPWQSYFDEISRTNGIKNGTPETATASGTQGEIKWDSNFVYVCVEKNIWKRSAIATW